MVKVIVKKTEIKPFDTLNQEDLNLVANHLITSPLYLKIMYDKYKKLYYRFYLDAVELERDGKYSTYGDKDLYLIVYDSDFKILKEIKLDKDHFWQYSFVTRNGLYIQ